jgi:hypothetical protein
MLYVPVDGGRARKLEVAICDFKLEVAEEWVCEGVVLKRVDGGEEEIGAGMGGGAVIGARSGGCGG